MRAFHNRDASPQVRQTDTLRPALASIPEACRYMGDVSRAKFYSHVLPLLQTVHIGSRHLVVVASMDRLIDSLKEASPENQNAPLAPQQTANCRNTSRAD
jgi:hypothetical protein